MHRYIDSVIATVAIVGSAALNGAGGVILTALFLLGARAAIELAGETLRR